MRECNIELKIKNIMPCLNVWVCMSINVIDVCFVVVFFYNLVSKVQCACMCEIAKAYQMEKKKQQGLLAYLFDCSLNDGNTCS